MSYILQQVVTNTLATNMAHEEVTVRVFSNVDDEARGANLSQMPLILYASVKRGLSPVIDAEVECLIVAGTHKWSIKLWDNGNGGKSFFSIETFSSRGEKGTTFLHDFLLSPSCSLACLCVCPHFSLLHTPHWE